MEVIPGPKAQRAVAWWTIALVLGLCLFCYWPALGGGPVWDDSAHITRPELRGWDGLARIWAEPGATQQYYPVLHTAFWVEHRLWGDAALGYHLVNVLLHAGSAGLLIAVLRRLGVPGSGLAGILFAVHPVCVESVAWISEQKNTLSLVLYLLAALAYLRFDRRRPGSWKDYALASALFTLAVLTKTVTATLPAALLLVAWWKRGKVSLRKDAMPLLPWFAFSVAAGLFTAWVERRLIGAEGVPFDLSLPQRTLLAGRVVWFYLGKLLWPADLVFVYAHWDVPSQATGWIGFLAAAAGVTTGLWILSRRIRGPLAAWLFFVGSLFPALGFFNVYPFLFSYVADHFQYLASLGAFAAAGAGTAFLSRRANGPGAPAACWIAAAAVVATLAGLSRAQSRRFGDLPSLYRATLAGNPNCWMAHNNLGVWCAGRGDLAAALDHYREAIRLRPDYAEAHFNLGNAWLRNPAHWEDAIAEYQQALRLWPSNAEIHNNLGNAWLRNPGHLDDAIAEYQQALRLRPDYAEAHNNLGNAWLRDPGHLDNAIAEYRQALRLRPDYAEAHNNLGNALSGLSGGLGDAIAEYREALRLRPDYAAAHFNLAAALVSQPGGAADAAAHLEAYLKLQPDDEGARAMLIRIRDRDRRAP